MTRVRGLIAALAALATAGVVADGALADVVRGDHHDGPRATVLTTAQLKADSLGRIPTQLHPEEHEERPVPRRPRPDAPPGPDGGVRRLRSSLGAATVSASSTSFDGPTLRESGAYPPDTMGAVGPTQYVVMINGRVRTYDKATGLPDGQLNQDTDVFWSPVMTPGPGNFTSDPHIRYDRLSGRWIAVMIDVPGGLGTQRNRIMVAVSSSSTITSSTLWSFYFWTSPSGEFADYPTLGVDANALYVGTNEFSTDSQCGKAGHPACFLGTNAYVVQKGSVVGGGPIHFTEFDHVAGASTSGPFTPQGVDNPTPGATAGYFIGVDNVTFSQLDIRRVNDPGGASPTLSSFTVPVPSTYYPENVPHRCDGSCRTPLLDALEDRLYAAQIRDGHLWTAHNIGVMSNGQTDQSATRNKNDRTASRWYEISLSGTPSLVQSGNVFDGAATRPRSYWIPTLAVNGQGIMAIGGSTSNVDTEPDGWFASRLPGDPAGTVTGPTRYTTTTGVYDPEYDRWGDYSMTTVDPDDDQTVWTIQEYVNPDSVGYNGVGADETDWGTRIVRLLAPAPLAPTDATPSALTGHQASVHVDLSGPAAAGWFDPGSGFAKRLAVSVGCGITVNAVTFNSANSIGLDLNTSSATRGSCDITVTNPDGQSATATGLLSTNSPPVANEDSYAAQQDTLLHGASVLANDTDADGDTLTATLATGPSHGTVSLASDGTFDYTPAAGFTGADSFTYKADDGIARSDAATVSVNVHGAANAAPVGTADGYDIPHSGVLEATSTLANDTDPDGDHLTATKLSDPDHGTLTFADDGTFTYVADSGFYGSDSFTYAASDGALQSDPVTVTLDGPADEAPVAVADSYAVPSSGALDGSSVLANDTDADGDQLTATTVSSPAHGSVTLSADGTFHYVATTGFSGLDSFSYTASDGRRSSSPATVLLNVAVPSSPSTGGGGGGGSSSAGDTTTATTEPAPALTPPSLTSGTVVPIAPLPSPTTATTTTTAPRCVVPKLVRHTVRYSRARLKAAHCGVGSIRRVRSTAVPRGRVVRTVPAAGRRVAAGTKVALRIRR